ncbi:MAG: Crp/Fnr family transcriptional regulator [Clostridiales bacterium]|nr:Crp/Fnr family transcriptional regulator [Clostridiales bacterium]
MKIFKQLKKCPLFSDFDNEQINKLFDIVDARIVKYSRGQLVAKEDTKINELCILLRGNLLEFKVKPNGEKEVLRSIVDGDILGLEKGYHEPYELGHCAVSALDCTILYITLQSIFEQQNPLIQKLIYNMVKEMSAKINSLQENNKYITIKSMRLKIALLLYDNYQKHNSLEFHLGMNRNETAKYLSVSRPSMSREMAKMSEEGMFEYKKDWFKLTDLAAIEKIIKTGR